MIETDSPSREVALGPGLLGQLKAKRREWAADLLLIWALVYTIYHSAFDFIAYNPEYASWWLSLNGLTWKATFHTYLEPSTLFYRPTVAVLYKFITVFVADMHNVMAWKLITIFFMLVLAATVYVMVRIVWCGSRFAAIMATLFLAANPVTFIIVSEMLIYELFGAAAAIASVIAFYASLNAEAAVQARKAYIVSMVLMFIAMTSREMAFTVPIFNLVLLATHYVFHYKTASRKRLLEWAMPATLIFLVFIVVRYSSVASLPKSGAYRTQADFNIMAANAERMTLWIVRLFTSHLRDYIDIHDTIITRLFGVLALLATAAGWILKLVREKRTAVQALVALLAWIGLFLVLPVYAGYAPWHVFLPSIGFSILFGLGCAELVRSFRPAPLAAAAGILVIGVLTTLGAQDYTVQLTHPGRHPYYQINLSALQNPPVAVKGMSGAPLVFFEGGPNDWAYGAGNLFKFVYSNPAIEEARFDNASAIPIKTRLVWLTRDKAYFFRATPDDNSHYRWYDDSPGFTKECLKRVAEESDRLLAAEKYEETISLLKPLIDRYPDAGLIQFHFAYGLEGAGRKADAQPYYTRAVGSLPANFWLYFSGGRIRAGRPDWNGACADLRRVSVKPLSYPGMSALITENCYR